jgi:outer membrane immunogenic protein
MDEKSALLRQSYILFARNRLNCRQCNQYRNRFRGIEMKRVMLTGVAIATLLAAGSAMAADMSVPFKAAPMAAVPVYNWTGCYIGIHGGGAAIRENQTSTWSDGGLFGGQLGCNYQIDHLVIGIEGEGAWSGVSSSQGGNGGPATTFKNAWDADVAMRFGLAYDRFFVYEKIGASWSDHQFNLGGTTGRVTVPGLLWGFGLEYGLTPQWTAKIETDFIFNAATDATMTTVGATTFTTSVNSTAVLAKVGLNYRF